MKKNNKEDVSKASEAPRSNVRSFFTKEINSKISEMTAKEMESVLRGMIDSREFVALLKYTGMRTTLLDATLRSINPTTDPHKISLAQGCLAGVCDIESYIIDLNAPRPKESTEEGDGQPKPEGVIIG